MRSLTSTANVENAAENAMKNAVVTLTITTGHRAEKSGEKD